MPNHKEIAADETGEKSIENENATRRKGLEAGLEQARYARQKLGILPMTFDSLNALHNCCAWLDAVIETSEKEISELE